MNERYTLGRKKRGSREIRVMYSPRAHNVRHVGRRVKIRTTFEPCHCVLSFSYTFGI